MEIIDYPNYLIYPDGRVYSKYKKELMNLQFWISPKRPDDKYYKIGLCKNGKQKSFKVHRLVMKHFKPEEWNPDLQVDHINQNKLDNRIENLRCVTQSINLQNRGIQKNNKSGVKNISYDKRYNTWVYKKTINGKKNYKRFKTKEEAIKFKDEYENK